MSKSKVVIFGGATDDTGKYIITGDTYALDLISSKWSKLEGTVYSMSELLEEKASLCFKLTDFVSVAQALELLRRRELRLARAKSTRFRW